MARYKVMGMTKGNLAVIAQFNNKKEAEAYVRVAQRSAKQGSISIQDSGEEEPAPVVGQPAGAAAIGRQAEVVNFVNQPSGGSKMPYAYIVGAAVAILVGAGLLIDYLNTLLGKY